MIRDYSQLIYKTFEYLNGKVNPINKVRDILIHYNSNSPVFANYILYGNHINIYPYSIEKYMQEYYSNESDDLKNVSIKLQIVETICHELFHADQIIKPGSYDNDSDVERQVHYMSSKFFNYHLNDLCDILDIDISRHDICSNMNILDYERYKRKDSNNYILQAIYDTIVNDKKHSIEEIRLRFDRNIHLVLKINGTEYIIKQYGEYMNIDEFNTILYNNIAKYNSKIISYSFKSMNTEYGKVGIIDVKVMGALYHPVHYHYKN